MLIRKCLYSTIFKSRKRYKEDERVQLESRSEPTDRRGSTLKMFVKRGLASLVCLMLVAIITKANSDRNVNDDLSPQKLPRNRLKGKELRVVTGHFPPQISVLRNNSGYVTEYSNNMYQLLLYLSEKLHFTFKIFPASENTFGVKYNHTWNGVIGNITRNEADLGLVPMTVSLQRYEGVDFSGFTGGDSTGILVKYPAASISFTNVFDVFSPLIWIGFVISGIAITAISVIFSYVIHVRTHFDEKPGMGAGSFGWYLYGTMFSQGSHFSSSQSPQKLLAATWCLVAFILVNIYNSNLISYMSVTYQRPAINFYHDLATATEYKAAVLIGSIQDIDLLVTAEVRTQSKNGDWKIIADRIQKCSVLECRKFSFQEMAVSVLEEDKCVSILPWSVGISFLRKYNSERISCRLALAYEKTLWKAMYLAVPKSSPYTEEINRESLWYFDTGLRDYWYGIYEKLPQKCGLDYNSKGVATKRSSNQIKLEHIYLPFLILIGGCLLGFMQFFREKFICPLACKSTVGLVVI